MLALRDAVLRQPIGFSLYDEDLSGEQEDITLAALAGNEVVGCVLLHPADADTYKLRQMAVAPEHANNGIGRQLLEVAEAYAQQHGKTIITLHARVTAMGFYEKLGYEKQGDVFTEVGIPHVLMQKMLG